MAYKKEKTPEQKLKAKLKKEADELRIKAKILANPELERAKTGYQKEKMYREWAMELRNERNNMVSCN